MQIFTLLSALAIHGGTLLGGDGVPAQSAPTAADVPAAVEQARVKLAEALDHYPDTRFRNVKVVARPYDDGSYRVTFCGEIDGPNRMGGRTGFHPFRLVPESSFAPLFVSPADGCPGERIDQKDYAPALSHAASPA